SWLQTDSATVLAHLQFSVLALGDTNYAEFCAAGKKIDARLEQLGASRIFPRVDCDVDYEATAKQWMDGALAAALRSSSDQSSSSSPDSPKLPSIGGASFAIQIGNREDTGNHQHASSSGGPAPTFSKANPFPSRLLKNLCLNKAGSAKEVRHFELDL